MFLFHCINLFKFSSFPRMMLLHLKRTHVADSGASVSLLDTPPVPKLRKLYLCCPRSQFMRSIHSHCHEEGTEELPPYPRAPLYVCALLWRRHVFAFVRDARRTRHDMHTYVAHSSTGQFCSERTRFAPTRSLTLAESLETSRWDYSFFVCVHLLAFFAALVCSCLSAINPSAMVRWYGVRFSVRFFYRAR